MINSILMEDLADSPPQLWAKRIRQAEILSRFDRGVGASLHQVDEAASALEIKRRQIYALLDARRRRLAGKPASGPRTGRHYHIGLDKEQVIADAIATIGPGARLTDVYQEAERLSRERGIEAPSATSVRTRFCESGPLVDLAERLVSDCDMIADFCELELAISCDGKPVVANLLAVFEPRSSIILDHQLYFGRPTVGQIRAWLLRFCVDRSFPEMPSINIGVPLTVLTELQSGPLFPDPWRLVPTSATRKVSEGAAISAAFGQRVGRIAIRPKPKARGKMPTFGAVPKDTARLVINHIISSRNGDLEAELMRRRGRETRFHSRENGGEQMLEIIDNVSQAPAFN